jgi:DNA-binding MarR family transcriptional regulator
MLSENKLGAVGLLIADALTGAMGEASPSAAALLLSLHYHPDLTATELAKVAGIAQPTATRVIDGLVRRGWLERGSREGRTTQLTLTAAGRKQARALQAARLKAMRHLLDLVPAAERRAFERACDAILAEATTSRAFARTTCRLCDHAVCDGPLCPAGTRAAQLERMEATVG